MSSQNFDNFKELVKIISMLRSPEGCPWDREQDHKSLRENLLQETYEALDAIDSGDFNELKEELGDVLLQVVLHSQIADEEGKFNIEDVAKGVSDKLIRRHPHVFSNIKVKNSAEVIVNWEKIKKQEKPERKSAVSGIAKTLPALMSAAELSKKAVKTGFEWTNVESLWECVDSEIKEFKSAVKNQNAEEMEDELGDILFSFVNVARWHGIDPELALLKANKKFEKRFQTMENIAVKELRQYNSDEFEELWQEAKKQLQKNEK
ncbi:MAG TPA: nucleoside triphosphate pyrophosphohydrolase [Candidatus Gastranaerophilales bacterium]|nr:nucleoside triphosphate pyrophosphohydrolase [Candidatus Gastranaerophilales bacterium]